MNDADLLDAQRRLRRALFEGRHAVRWPAARDLAARLLLYLDDPRVCWQISTDWLREAVDADRTDGGFGGYVLPDGQRRCYRPLAESRHPSVPLLSVLTQRFDPDEPGLRVVWRNGRPTPFGDIAVQREMSEPLRRMLLAAGTAAKLALPIADGPDPLGLLCADWHRPSPRWEAGLDERLRSLAADVLGPVLGTSMRLAAAAAADGGDPAAALALLTPAERRVAQLIGQGLSYKEVARRLDRSLSTIDHRLRSIRQKVGVRSTARLVHWLAERGGADAAR